MTSSPARGGSGPSVPGLNKPGTAGLLQDQRLKEVSEWVAGLMAVGWSVGSGRRRDFRSPAAPRA